MYLQMKMYHVYIKYTFIFSIIIEILRKDQEHLESHLFAFITHDCDNVYA